MVKRRLSHQQKRRIRQAQNSLDVNDENLAQGLVISHHGGEVEIEPLDTDRSQPDNLHCSLRTNLGPVVCGDHVLYQDAAPTPAVVSILPRANLLRRQDGFGQVKAVAANVSQILVCMAIEPEPNLYLLDQYLVSARQQDIDATIVLNKMDLWQSDSPDPFDLEKIYGKIGYRVLHTSIVDGLNVAQLQQCCVGKVNVISGVSGVGKSSLTKAILPQLDIRIREISQANREGRHTTRTSRLYHLPLGGDLIDTPGVRGFRPVLDPDRPVASGFRELDAMSAHCRFHNCRHVNEPGCAIAAAIVSGEMASSRYDSYLKMLQETDTGNRF